MLDEPAHLFDVEPRARYGFSTQGMNYHLFGDKFIEVPNEPEALIVNYLLKADDGGSAKITVKDFTGKVVRELEGPAKAGLNRALVQLAGERRPWAGGGAAASPATAPLAIGDYTVTVNVAGQTLTKPAKVRARIGAQ